MAGSVNKVILVGNLGRDPEIRRTQDGRPIANLRVATSESWRDKNTGERKEKTEWHRVVIFNEGLCKIAEQYLKKGSKVYLEGQLQTRKWQDKDGNDKYSTEVVLQGFNATLTMLDGRAGGAGGGGISMRPAIMAAARLRSARAQAGDGRLPAAKPRRHGRRDPVLAAGGSGIATAMQTAGSSSRPFHIVLRVAYAGNGQLNRKLTPPFSAWTWLSTSRTSGFGSGP